MRSKLFGISLIAALVVLATGCGGSETPPNNTTPATSNSAPANSSLETTKKPEAATTNDAPTLGPVINAYYDALRNKDAAGVRKVMERQFLNSIEADMKDQKKTDIVAFLVETDKLPAGKMEARNEQISGNRGVAEIKGGVYKTWAKAVFVKEDGIWKVSNQVSDPGAQ